ncbi:MULTISPECIES: hypothetical protein [unclassified Campylobacter]|nr:MULTISPECIES: hypothetical protein [unclassified Campylobacter]
MRFKEDMNIKLSLKFILNRIFKFRFVLVKWAILKNTKAKSYERL